MEAFLLSADHNSPTIPTSLHSAEAVLLDVANPVLEADTATAVLMAVAPVGSAREQEL
jgi:hypothetical protein